MNSLPEQSTQQQFPRKQRGAALLILVILLVFAASSFVLNQYSINDNRNRQDDKTQKALAAAKQALISNANIFEHNNNAGIYGLLPCPDSNPALVEGVQDGNCAGAQTNILGYLPWRQLGINALRDSSGECLRYVVSGGYHETPLPAFLNGDSNGLIEVFDAQSIYTQGPAATDRVVALVIAPGAALAGQNRNKVAGTICGQDFVHANYLEGNGAVNNAVLSGAANTIDQFINSDRQSVNQAIPFNDRIITITRNELWNEILRGNTEFVNSPTVFENLIQTFAQCLVDYAATTIPADQLPYPVPVDLNNNYHLDAFYDDDNSIGALARLPDVVDTSNIVTASPVNNLITACGASITAEEITLWRYWKDHFFYAVSAAFQPGGAGMCTPGTCITVDGTQRAAVVFYSGPAILPIVRGAPAPIPAADPDNKANISNYLENIPAPTDPGGNGLYVTVAPPAGNDTMYCISEPPLAAVAC